MKVTQYFTSLCLLAFLSLFTPLYHASAQELFEGRIDQGTYENKEIGWNITIPDGWKIRGKAEIAQVEGIGQDAFERSTGEKIELDHTPLLYLDKNKFSRFTSATSPYDLKKDGDHKKLSQDLFTALVETFRNEGLKVNEQRGEETIGGVAFNTLIVTIFSPDGKQKLLWQKMFDGQVRDRSLNMSITYKEKKDAQAMFDAVKASTFQAKKES